MWDFSGVAHHRQPIIIYIWDGFGKPLQHQSRNSKARSQKVSHKLYHIWRSLVDVRVAGAAHRGQHIIVYIGRIWNLSSLPFNNNKVTKRTENKVRGQKVSHKLYRIWRSLVNVRVAGAAHRGQPIIVYLGRIWNLSSHPIQSDPAKKSQKSKFKHDVRCYCLLARQLDMRANTY